MKVLFLLCEGKHDAQFLGRILQQSGQYELYGEQLKSYPRPLGRFVRQRFQDSNVDEITLGRPQPGAVPVAAYRKAGAADLVLLIPTGGKAPSRYTRELVAAIVESFSPTVLVHRRNAVEGAALLFVQDADAAGVAGTAAQFAASYEATLGLGDSSRFRNFQQGQWYELEASGASKPLRVALFVLTGDDGDTGTLEGILAPLFQRGDSRLFAGATEFVEAHFGAMSGGRDETAYQSSKMKGVLSCCGQTADRKTGNSLAVIVRDTALLDGAFDFEDQGAVWTRLLKLVNEAFAD